MFHCTNCEASLSAETEEARVTEFLVSFPDCERSVSIFEALCTVFAANPSRTVVQNLGMCGKCAQVVEGLFRSYVELMELSKATADICKLVRQAEFWHRLQGEQGDFNILSVVSFDLKEELVDPDQADIYDSSLNPGLFSKEIKTVPKKRKINAPDEDVDRDYDLLKEAKKTNRRKSHRPVKILAAEETLSGLEEDADQYDDDPIEDQDDDFEPEPEEVEEEWKPNVRRSGRISEARVRKRLQRADALKRRKKLTVKYTGRNSKTKAKAQKALKEQIQKRKRGRPRKPVDMKANNRKKVWTAQEEEEVITVDFPPPVPALDEFGFEVIVSQKKKYKRVKKVSEKKSVIPCTHGGCPEKFYTLWMLEHHVSIQHLRIVPRECPECGLKYFRDEILQRHICVPFLAQEEDRRKRPFVCQLCGRSMANRGNFTHHCSAHDHAVEERLKCGQCKLTFKRLENLHKHEKIHSLAKPSWQCDICGKVFYVKRRLKEHNEIHLETKRYMCSVCGMRFAQQKAMIRHQTIHANLNRYICPLCKKGFKRKDHLHQHYRSKVHPRALIESVRGQDVGPLPMELFQESRIPEFILPDTVTDIIQTDPGSEQREPQPMLQLVRPDSSPEATNPQSQDLSAHSQDPQIIVLPIQALPQHQHHPQEFGFSDLLSL